MMKRLLIAAPLLLFFYLSAFPQATGPKPKTTRPANTPAEQPAPTPPVAAPTIPAGQSLANRIMNEPIDTAVENRLVALALNGPEYDASNHQNRINELDLRKTKNTWLNLLTISTNYNDQSFAKPANTQGGATYVYPKYFFGVTIPLGIIFSQGTQVKAARETISYGKDQQELLARRIKADVLSKYRQYRNYAALILLQGELINDVLATSTQAEDNFKKGLISVEIYIATQRASNDELAKNMTLRLQQDLIRIEIERIIGVSLDEVLHTAQPAPLFHNTKKP
jgi:hypothetical protein